VRNSNSNRINQYENVKDDSDCTAYKVDDLNVCIAKFLLCLQQLVREELVIDDEKFQPCVLQTKCFLKFRNPLCNSINKSGNQYQ
jgi:hypothetical protein